MTPTVTLTTQSPKLRVTALAGLTAPVVTGGYGGWSQIPRPRRVSLTEWEGIEPLQLAVALLFDGFASDTSVEAGVATLERMARPAQPGAEPPVVSIIGAVPHADRRWVIDTNGLEWDQATIEYAPGGFRTRQAVTVKLIEYIADDRVDKLTPAEKARRKAATGSTKAGHGRPSNAATYTVRQGDTLSSVASSQLGDYKRWTEIADANGIRDPKAIQAGQVLTLP